MTTDNTAQDLDTAFDESEYVALIAAVAQQARVSFPAFLTFMHPPGHSDYILGRLHMGLAHVVQGVIDGTTGPRQAVSVPPQHGKSRLLSVRAVAWVLGHMPGIHIALTGFSYGLLTSFVSEVRSMMASPQYQLVFPDMHAVFGSDRQDEAKFTNGSSVLVKSCGTKLTGRRVDWLIIDDAHPGRAEAESKNARDKIKQWYFADCLSRLSPNAKVFIIGTRWHPEDLIGALTAEEYTDQLRLLGQEASIFNVVNYPAIADHFPEAGEVCPLGRKPGETLFPEQRPLSFMESVKAESPAYEWESQYQGRPRSSGSGQVNIERFKMIDLSEVPTDIPWSRGWDLALTEAQTSDFSVGALCAYHKERQHFYIIDIWRRKLVWGRLKPQVVAVAMLDKERYNCTMMGLEAVSGFKIGLQGLRSSLAGVVSIVEKNPPRGGKLMRALDWLNAVECGRVSLVRGSWNKDFKDELHGFPDGAHDDQVDGVSVAWETLARSTKLLYA